MNFSLAEYIILIYSFGLSIVLIAMVFITKMHQKNPVWKQAAIAAMIVPLAIGAALISGYVGFKEKKKEEGKIQAKMMAFEGFFKIPHDTEKHIKRYKKEEASLETTYYFEWEAYNEMTNELLNVNLGSIDVLTPAELPVEQYKEKVEWFDVNQLGDSVMVFTSKSKLKGRFIIYSNQALTKAFIVGKN